jgi:hypothetical protein
MGSSDPRGRGERMVYTETSTPEALSARISAQAKASDMTGNTIVT